LLFNFAVLQHPKRIVLNRIELNDLHKHESSLLLRRFYAHPNVCIVLAKISNLEKKKKVYSFSNLFSSDRISSLGVNPLKEISVFKRLNYSLIP